MKSSLTWVRPGALRLVVVVFFALLVGGCFGGGSAGDTCSDEYGCEVGLRCLEVEGLSGGVCTFLCEPGECPADTQCVSTEYGPLCLMSCSAGCDQELECSDAYESLDGVCWTGAPTGPP